MELRVEPLSLQRFQQVISVVDADPTARNAWDNLIKDGCEPAWLAFQFATCVFPPHDLRATLLENRSEFQRHAKHAAKLAKQMKKVAEEIRRAQGTEGLRDFLSLGIALDRLLEDEADDLLFVTVPSLKARSRHVLTDDLPLLQLCAYVERITGKLHYPEIVAVLTATNGSIGRAETLQPETLSKKIRRLKGRLGEKVIKVVYANTRINTDKKKIS